MLLAFYCFNWHCSMPASLCVFWALKKLAGRVSVDIGHFALPIWLTYALAFGPLFLLVVVPRDQCSGPIGRCPGRGRAKEVALHFFQLPTTGHPQGRLMVLGVFFSWPYCDIMSHNKSPASLRDATGRLERDNIFPPRLLASTRVYGPRLWGHRLALVSSLVAHFGTWAPIESHRTTAATEQSKGEIFQFSAPEGPQQSFLFHRLCPLSAGLFWASFGPFPSLAWTHQRLVSGRPKTINYRAAGR